MKILTIIITLTFCSIGFSGPGHSHGHGHGHSRRPADPCKKLATKDLKSSSVAIGKCHIVRLSTPDEHGNKGKIDESWVDAKVLQNKSIPKRGEWLVTFKNLKGKKGTELFIFLKSNGEFVAANFTGK
ncbi:MAG: hypothetical protein HOO06_12480 [Bdellovibrionaceae bacterium]|jgi:hypothetical protein|nr:hypothetical protein [Pseudobdellovibrionaceae bacterium]